MVSRIPTFSFKKGRIPRHLVLPSLLVAALTMGVIASSPWIGLSLLELIYLGSGPLQLAGLPPAGGPRPSGGAAGRRGAAAQRATTPGDVH